MSGGDRIPFKDLILKTKPEFHPVIWGAKVTPEFIYVLFCGCEELNLKPDYLMACMAWESDETFSPAIENYADSGAVGLIQFMPQTAKYLGTTIEKLSHMTAPQQLEYVFKHFKPYSNRIKTLSDYYMTILYPRAIGEPDNYSIFVKSLASPKRLTEYLQNKGLDINNDGIVTKLEAASVVYAKLERGKRFINKP